VGSRRPRSILEILDRLAVLLDDGDPDVISWDRYGQVCRTIAARHVGN